MMKFELLTQDGAAIGVLHLDLARISKVERGGTGCRDTIGWDGGYAFVDLSSEQLAAIYRVMAEALEREASEKNDALRYIK